MRHNRIREALGRIYDQHPPQIREHILRLEEDPKSRVFAPLAENFRRLGRIDEAIAICLKGLEFHPDYSSGRLALAKCYIDQEKFLEARRELERVISLSPENLLAQRLLGDMLLGLDDRKGAIHHYKMALLLAPEDVALHEKLRSLEQEVSEIVSVTTIPDPEATLKDEEAVTVTSGFKFEGEPESEELDKVQDSVAALMANAPEVPEPLWIEKETTFIEEDVVDESTKSQINKLLGLADNEDEDASFKSLPFNQAFVEKERERNKEITTETLADLYLVQGQTHEALEMLERLYKQDPSAELLVKIQSCKEKLGVDTQSLLRQRQIETLRGILRRQSQSDK